MPLLEKTAKKCSRIVFVEDCLNTDLQEVATLNLENV